MSAQVTTLHRAGDVDRNRAILSRHHVLWGHYVALMRAAPARALGLPSRRAIDPAALKSILPFVLMARREADDRFVISLAGTGIVGVLGTDPTGRDLYGPFSGKAREAAECMRQQMVDRRVGVFSRHWVTVADGQDHRFDSLLLPLGNGGARVEAIIYHAHVSGPAGGHVYRSGASISIDGGHVQRCAVDLGLEPDPAATAARALPDTQSP